MYINVCRCSYIILYIKVYVHACMVDMILFYPAKINNLFLKLSRHESRSVSVRLCTSVCQVNSGSAEIIRSSTIIYIGPPSMTMGR